MSNLFICEQGILTNDPRFSKVIIIFGDFEIQDVFITKKNQCLKDIKERLK